MFSEVAIQAREKKKKNVMDINVGDVLKLKKQHPCGSREWEVLRVGADFRLKCLGCGHQIMIARKLLEKNVKEIVEKSLKSARGYGIMFLRETLYSLLIYKIWARDQKEVTNMNKYELAVVVSAKIEDDERAAVVDKCKALVERFGGNITEVDEWGKKKLAYEVQKMKEAFYYFIRFEAESTVPAEIESRVRIMDNVIRYLCVRQDEA